MTTPDDLLLLLFTSGSTGAPKAVKFSQARAAAAAKQMWFTPADVLYCAMPLFHGNALNAMALPAMGTGATLVLERRFSASALMPAVREHGVTFFSTVGRALSYVLATPTEAADRDHQLQVVLAPEASQADVAAFNERFGATTISGYGSSENAVKLVPSGGLRPDALGVAMPGEDIAVIDAETLTECPRGVFDDNGRLLNADEAVGEIVGRNVVDRFEGYWNNPEAEAARTNNGWYWTGDLGYRDDEGVFYFAGRTAEWIRVDGENFAAAPLERLLRRADGVADAVVFGVPDERTADDQVMAVLEVPSGDFDGEAFDRWLQGQPDLGAKWTPRYVVTTPALPLLATSKLDRAKLRRQGWLDAEGELWWRPERRDSLVRMDADGRSKLLATFAEFGRQPTRPT